MRPLMAALVAVAFATDPDTTSTDTYAIYDVLAVGRCNGGDGEAIWIDPMDVAEIERYNARHNTSYDASTRDDFGKVLAPGDCWDTCALRLGAALVAADFQFSLSDCNCYDACACLGYRWVSSKDKKAYTVLPAGADLPRPCDAPTYAPTTARPTAPRPTPGPAPAPRPRPTAPRPYEAAREARARRPQRWSRDRRPHASEAPMRNFYAQSLSVFVLVGFVACGLSCARGALRRCAAAAAAALAARAAVYRGGAARPEERASLVVPPDPDLDASRTLEIDG